MSNFKSIWLSKIDRHIAFWLGVFCAVIIALPFLWSIRFINSSHTVDYAAFLFGALCTIALFFVILILFRELVLKKLVGSAESSLDQVTHSFGELISGVAKGSPEEIKKHSEKLSRNLIGWYTWTNFYKWVISVCIGILGTFAVLAGTVLLVDQNEQLRKSNTVSQDQFKDRQTSEIILSLIMDKSVNDQLYLIFSNKSVNEKNKNSSEEEHKALQNILNLYETISTLANNGKLNKDILVKSLKGSYLRLYENSKNYIRTRRCTSKNKKAYIEFELFVHCQIMEYNSSIDRAVLKQCIQKRANVIISQNYCNEPPS